jgi:hypothetical protein
MVAQRFLFFWEIELRITCTRRAERRDLGMLLCAEILAAFPSQEWQASSGTIFGGRQASCGLSRWAGEASIQ